MKSKTHLASFILLLGLLLGITTWEPYAQAAPVREAANVFSTAYNANTDILSTDYTPRRIGLLRITVVVGTDTVVEVQIIQGATTVEADLNSGTALTAGQAYTFTLGCHPDNSYNIHVETGATVTLLVDEMDGDGA